MVSLFPREGPPVLHSSGEKEGLPALLWWWWLCWLRPMRRGPGNLPFCTSSSTRTEKRGLLEQSMLSSLAPEYLIFVIKVGVVTIFGSCESFILKLRFWGSKWRNGICKKLCGCSREQNNYFSIAVQITCVQFRRNLDGSMLVLEEVGSIFTKMNSQSPVNKTLKLSFMI